MRRPQSYFNPRSPHGERPAGGSNQARLIAISIHAPRTGSDVLRRRSLYHQGDISIHAPRTGSDCIVCEKGKKPVDFNPRSPHGERHRPTMTALAGMYFNPRSPHGERRFGLIIFPLRDGFQSTLPARGATYKYVALGGIVSISIHAPRTGSDNDAVAGNIIREHFNPRSPHGERRIVMPQGRTRGGFQSTLPARGATWPVPPGHHQAGYFNPRSPHGERPYFQALPAQGSLFQSTLPARGATIPSATRAFGTSRFQSTLPARGATGGFYHRHRRHDNFNPRSPHGERPAQHPDPPRRGHFNPRSPHGERPGGQGCRRAWRRHFNPRSPHGERRDRRRRANRVDRNFNPRSPHGERPSRKAENGHEKDFNPRSPHGERPHHQHNKEDAKIFQSTLPARGATFAGTEIAGNG